MILAVDVQYAEDGATGAAVAFADWPASAAAFEEAVRFPGAPQAYEPGAFFKRELPLLLALVAAVEGRGRLDVVVVDGYVWLGEGRPGLGAHLHSALDGSVAVIGVAKTAFRDSGAAEVRRGTSARPLYVSAVGVPTDVACESVARMHGDHRIPTLLKRVDRIARGAAISPPQEPRRRST